MQRGAAFLLAVALGVGMGLVGVSCGREPGPKPVVVTGSTATVPATPPSTSLGSDRAPPSALRAHLGRPLVVVFWTSH